MRPLERGADMPNYGTSAPPVKEKLRRTPHFDFMLLEKLLQRGGRSVTDKNHSHFDALLFV